MKYKNKENSRFNKLVRIEAYQLNWLRQNKKKNECRTMAGFLSKIINEYKRNGKTIRKTQKIPKEERI